MAALSNRWSGRLQDVNNLQGLLKVDSENDTVRVKPTWPEWLVDVTYEVMKRSIYGKLQRRALKLTQYHILNIRNGFQITKSFKYLDVAEVYLRDENSFILKVFLKSGEMKSIRYYSPISFHIVQQLTTRHQVTRALMKSGFSQSVNIPDSLVGYSTDVTALLISQISVDTSNDYASDLVSFATMLGERMWAISETPTGAFNTVNNGDDEGWHEKSDGFRESITDRSSSVNRDSIDSRDREKKARSVRRMTLRDLSSPNSVPLDDWNNLNWTAGESSKLIAFQENSAENDVEKRAHALFGGESTPEAHTRQHFANSFDSTKNIDEIRLFIDGIYEYMMEKRGIELASLLEGKETFSLRTLDAKSLCILSFIVFSVVEETVFVSMKKDIISLVSSPETRQEEESLLVKMKLFSSRQQEDWDIPSSVISPNNWRSAVFEIAGVERNPTPTRRLNALVRTAKKIYAEFKEIVLPRLQSEGKGDTVLSADDLVPIFIYVLCQSGLKHPLLNRDLLWKICHPDMLRGECGYYLTIYESSLQFILDLPCGEDIHGERLTVIRESVKSANGSYYENDYATLRA